MKIVYNENPLRSEIIINDEEKEILRLKIHIDELEDIIWGAKVRLDKNKYDDASISINSIKNIKNLVDHSYNTCIKSLNEEHMGDCTCIPASCMKCYTEEFLGIHTIPKMSKHMGSSISSAFYDRKLKKYKTIDEALIILKDFKIDNLKNKKYKKYWQGWQENNKKSYEWLLEYKNKHKF